MPSIPPFRKRKQGKPSYFLFALRRPMTRAILALIAGATIYVLLFRIFVRKIPQYNNLAQGGNAVVSKACLLRDSVTSRSHTQVSHQSFDSRKRDYKSAKKGDLFRILCTSTRRKISWGSYQLRCRDLKAWASKCTKNVNIVTDISFEDLQSQRWIRYLFGQLREEEKIPYDATVFIKSFPRKGKILPIYGKMYIDMVDAYGYGDEDVPNEMNLILQTEWQGREVFPSHNFTAVEHWYNSFPADMALSGPPENIPSISHQANIKIATVWNTRRGKVPTEGGCPKISSQLNVSYQCLDKPFDISSWYLELFKEGKDKCEMEQTLANPQLGPGMLYYNVFRKFDALVVLAKNDTMKLKYGNVQRAVSQMRSGVPVLIEIRGKVLQDFVERFNYPCTFQRYVDDSISTKSSGDRMYKHWSFNEAVEQLKDPTIRQKCQEQGLVIAKNYAPSRIAKKFLRAVGFTGDFLC